MSWVEVEAYSQKYEIGILKEHKEFEDWVRCKVKTKELRNMHGAFGRVEDSFIELCKGRRLSEQLLENADSVKSNVFPRSKMIKQEWINKPAIYVQRTMSSGELYVADGMTRTFNASYHNEPWLDAMVITFDEEREVV